MQEKVQRTCFLSFRLVKQARKLNKVRFILDQILTWFGNGEQFELSKVVRRVSCAWTSFLISPFTLEFYDPEKTMQSVKSSFLRFHGDKCRDLSTIMRGRMAWREQVMRDRFKCRISVLTTENWYRVDGDAKRGVNTPLMRSVTEAYIIYDNWTCKRGFDIGWMMRLRTSSMAMGKMRSDDRVSQTQSVMDWLLIMVHMNRPRNELGQ